jgi:dihydroorotate dehydrogenase
MMSMYEIIRPLLFRLDPERAHDLTLKMLSSVGNVPPLRVVLAQFFKVENPALRVQAFGLSFPNPVGLAAGYDKDGVAAAGLASLGFGHIELGTVTPHGQAGNPRPRIFRLPEDGALINRMGFPNAGADALLERLQRLRRPGVVLGINIGKGVDTPLERASEDYLTLMWSFAPIADYLAVNISSPNTVGLRRLQARNFLEGLLAAIAGEREKIQKKVGKAVPILVKLAPDLSLEEIEDAVGVIYDSGMDGVIATNTTVERDNLHSMNASETGGLSGVPLRERATEIVRHIHNITQGRLPIVGVGGIRSASDAREKFNAGASLVQVYTGLVYSGPGIVRDILHGLLQAE